MLSLIPGLAVKKVLWWKSKSFLRAPGLESTYYFVSTLCCVKTRRSDCFSSTSQGLFLFLFLSPATFTRPKGTEQRRTRATERLRRVTRWPLKKRLKHQRRRGRRQSREVSSERQSRGWGGLMIITGTVHLGNIFYRPALHYTDSVGDWSSEFGLISWTLVRIFFWCPARDTPILWRSLEHIKTKTVTLMWFET